MQQASPLISVITVSFNNQATIRQTIESVLSQVDVSFEYWIIDGGSTDGTLDIIREYEGRLRYISEPDQGLYFAMNKGWQKANGAFVGFLNADDFYNNHLVLYRIAQAINDQPHIAAVYGDLAYVDANDTERVVRYWQSGLFSRSGFLWGWMPPHPTFYARKSMFEKFGGFRAEHFRSAADYEFMLRLLYKHQVPVAYVPHLFVRMRVGGLSNSSVQNRVRGNAEDRAAWKVNGLKPYFFTLFAKPLRKLVQFIQKPPREEVGNLSKRP